MNNDEILATIADFQQVFDSPSGKNVLHHLMRKSGFLRPSYIQGDPYTTAFNEGQRALVLDIISNLNMDIKLLEKELTKAEKLNTKGDDHVTL